MQPKIIISIIIAIIVATAAIYLTQSIWTVESFAEGYQEENYIQEVKVMHSYIGPFIGEIYNYLRDRYAPGTKMYIPQNGEGAKDPMLPLARSQITSWIDSAKTRISQQYDVQKYNKNWDLSYIHNKDGTIGVTSVENGVIRKYIV